MPIVTPRPSQVGFADLKATAPVSFVGMYGLLFGVDGPGPVAATAGSAEGVLASGSLMTSSRSRARTLASAAAFSTLATGTRALK